MNENTNKKGIFLTGTDTDIGKTYIAALLVKKLIDAGKDSSFFKVALSDEVYHDVLISSDVRYVCDFAGLKDDPLSLVSSAYRYPGKMFASDSISPFDTKTILRDYNKLLKNHEFIVAEGSGSSICDTDDDGGIIVITDVILALGLDAVVVATAGIGTVNHTVLTCAYLAHKGINIRGIILNHFDDNNKVHLDNRNLVERLTELPILACVSDGDTEIDIDLSKLL